MNYTSRSAIESYWVCPRQRYLNYFFDGIGIVPATRSIPLTTGTSVHAGIEHMAKWLKKANLSYIVVQSIQSIIDEAVEVGKEKYLAELVEKNFHGKGTTTDQQQEFTKAEQLALTEALIRAWGMRELPNLHDRFQVWEVEKEIAVSLTDSIILESRCDILLKERQNKDMYCYSLKTIKDYNQWIAKGYKDDLQGLLEMYAVETYLRESNRKIKAGIEFLEGYLKGETIEEVKKLLNRKLVADSPMAVKFCFLVKGKREEEKVNGKPTGSYHTSNSLIRGYKKFSTQGVEYAHSMYYPNPSTPSGNGRLGKGWEAFNVWDDFKGGVKGWMKELDKGEIQPECGDIISKYVVTPVENFRDEKEIIDTVEQVREQEATVFNNLFNGLLFNDLGHWPQYRKSCHYPQDCDYIPICHLRDHNEKPVSSEVRADPIGSGYYERRTPHHERERKKVVRTDNPSG